MGKLSKICPKCNREASGELHFCSFDGAELRDQSMDHFCSSCEKYYSADMQFCPEHGVELTPFTLPAEGLEFESDEDGEVMDEKALDSFSRGLCPKCGAWKNWEQHGSEYTCQTCMESFTYQDGLLKGSKTKTVYQVEKERLEILPYAPVLSVIDEKNIEYWLREFEKFDSSPDYRNWNWPSFFFGPYRYFWKGMWKKGLMIYGVLIVIEVALIIIEPEITFYSSNPISSGAAGPLSLAASLLIRAYLGNSGSRDYYKFIKSFDDNSSKARSALTIGYVFFAIAIALSVLGMFSGSL